MNKELYTDKSEEVEDESIKKRVLVVAYYWPPSGGSGVQRWLKFVKYLPQFGWTPYVFTPESPSFSIRDESLLRDVPPEAEVIHFPIWEPYDVFNKLSRFFSRNKKEASTVHIASKKKSLFHAIGIWIRGNLFIPDPRLFWIRPSVNFLEDFIRDNKIKVLITTGPPHSLHLIGYRLKKRIPTLKWLADFRDPWSEWGLLDTLQVTGLVRSFHRRLERNVLTTANVITTVTSYYVKRLENLSGRKVKLLSNGYDEDDFKHIEYKKTSIFIIRHAGVVNEKSNPVPFMNAVRTLCLEHAELRNTILVEFIGEVHPDFKAFVLQDNLLASITRFIPTIPHKKLLLMYGEASVLLLILTEYKGAEGYTGGKSFEYIATGLPIIAIGPSEGEAANLLRETSSGEVIEGKDVTKIKNTLLAHYNNWRSGEFTKRTVSTQYSRKELTRQLDSILQNF